MVATKTLVIAFPAIAFAWLCSFAIQPAQADYRAFFSHHRRDVVVQQQIVAVPAFVQPLTYYAAGQDLQAEALAEKVARLVEQKLVIRQHRQQQASTAPAIKPGAFAKCASCHTGENAAGGVVLDGTAFVSCHTYFRWGQIAGQGKDVPAKMHALISSMTPEQKGAINEAMLDLVAAGYSNSAEHAADKPPSPPEPEGGTLE